MLSTQSPKPRSNASAADIMTPPLLPGARAGEIATISHELRNSLAVITNAARMLKLPARPDSVDRARVLIERHVAQMTRHVQELMDTQSQDPPKVFLATRVDLRTIVRDAIEAMALNFSRRSHRVTVNLPEEAVWVLADSSRLEQVFSNLLINAAKYTADGGDITLTMEQLATHACVRIRDSGIGIAPANLATIFSLFVQVDAHAPRAEGGSGIGLCVVRDLLARHGGTVEALSEGLGKGSEFIVRLPSSEIPRD